MKPISVDEKKYKFFLNFYDIPGYVVPAHYKLQ